ALLAALERAIRGADEWLDGAVTWYQCRRPERAGRWAARGVAQFQRAEGSRQKAVGSPDGWDTESSEAALSRLPPADRLLPTELAARAVLARCLLAAGQPQAALQALPAAPATGPDPLEF